jgi:hypothetical protein
MLKKIPSSLNFLTFEFKQGQVHVVCPALKGMTNLNVFACLLGKMPDAEVAEFCDRINHSRTADTLCPRVPVSALPLNRTWEDSTREKFADFGCETEIRNNLIQILNIHSQFQSSKRLVFTLDQKNVFNARKTLNLLERILIESPKYRNFTVEYDIQS